MRYYYYNTNVMFYYFRYNYTLSCSLKFVQHLKHFEHLVSVLGQATEVLVRDFSCNAMVMELVREISRIDPRELGGELFPFKLRLDNYRPC